MFSTRGAEWDAAATEFGAEIEQHLAAVAELRAVLAPLLDDPHRNGSHFCVFCGAFLMDGDSGEHESDCPVLRRDALLGR